MSGALRTDLRVVERIEAGRRYVYVQDRRSGRVFGLAGEAYDVLAGRGVAVSPAARARLVARATATGLLAGAPAAPVARTPLNPFYVKVPLPVTGPVRRAARWLAPLLSWPGLAATGTALAIGVGLVLVDPARTTPAFLAFRDPGAWAWLYALLTATSVLHELGHAAACARYGGEVREVGLLFYVLRLGLYVDVSDAWLFGRRERVLVGLAGTYVETAALAAALLTWHATGARPAFLLAVVLTVHAPLNLFPFLRFDGYYVLSDLLEIKNLRPRAFRYLAAQLPWIGRAFRDPRPTPRRERIILGAYGATAAVAVALAAGAGAARAHRTLVHAGGDAGHAIAWALALALGAMAARWALAHARRADR